MKINEINKVFDGKYGFYVMALALLLIGCSPAAYSPSDLKKPYEPDDFPAAYYRQAIASGSTIRYIDKTQSLVTIIVKRGGSLARLGHDHVVASHDITGFVDMTTGRADLYILLNKLTVDEPALRTLAGFTTQPSVEAVEGTRKNMLGKVLESDQFPFAMISVKRSTEDPQLLKVTLQLHGKTQTFVIPARIQYMTNGINISGEMRFNQTAFGLTPFSVLGGALKVLDELELHFTVVATDTP